MSKIEITKGLMRDRSPYSGRMISWTVWHLSIDGRVIRGPCDGRFLTRRDAKAEADRLMKPSP